MPTMPRQNCPTGLAPRNLARPLIGWPAAPRSTRQDLPQARQTASHLRGHILGLSGQALKAQANSLPGLACHLLADN